MWSTLAQYLGKLHGERLGIKVDPKPMFERKLQKLVNERAENPPADFLYRINISNEPWLMYCQPRQNERPRYAHREDVNYAALLMGIEPSELVRILTLQEAAQYGAVTFRRIIQAMDNVA